jgi:tripartite-type tricarboxylate transporter receptor subunit TctC
MPRALKRHAIAMALAVAMLPVGATAEEVADFYRGRNVQIVVGHQVGTGFDVYARTLARHIGRHIPGNPTIVVQNMVGAVGLVSANWIYNIGPKDGTAMATFAHSAPLDPMLGQGRAKFDPLKFTWIGNMDESVGVCGVWRTTGVKRFEDLRDKEVLVGASGSGTAGPLSQSPTALNNLFGSRMKLVQGYKGSSEIKLAILRGEVQGICGLPLSTLRAEWAEHLKSGDFVPLLQLSRNKHPFLGEVPLVFDLARNTEDKQVLDLVFGVQAMGRPFAAPPGIPADRAKALRTAFMAAIKDPALVADAKKANLDLTPMSGEDLAAMVAGLYASPPAVIARTRDVIQARKK